MTIKFRSLYIIYIISIVTLFVSCKKYCIKENIKIKYEKKNFSGNKSFNARNFNECICGNNFNDLIPDKLKAKLDSTSIITLNYYPVLKEKGVCDGVYLFRLFSDKLRVPLYSFEEGRFSRYNYFIIVDNKIINFGIPDKEKKESYFTQYESSLKKKFGEEAINNLENSLIKGYEYVE